MQEAVVSAFADQFGYAPEVVVRAPGRINLIGEHTDYNGGYVLPGAIHLSIWAAFGRNTAGALRFYAFNLGEVLTHPLVVTERTQACTWANYLLGVVHTLHVRGHALPHGVDIVVGGDLPTGAGLSSSAALENAVGFGLNELMQFGLTRLDLVHVSKQSENAFVGMPCGIMDMFVSMFGRRGHLIELNCQNLSYQYIPFPSEYQICVCNTMVKHALVDSAFSTRVAQCNEALHALRIAYPHISCLSEATAEQLESTLKGGLDAISYKRAAHILKENARLLAVSNLLQSGVATLPQYRQVLRNTMIASHIGLQKEYEVSCEELDHLVDLASDLPFCHGTRMSGGGFGGCTINLVEPDQVHAFQAHIKAGYQSRFGIDPDVISVHLSDGVQRVM